MSAFHRADCASVTFDSRGRIVVVCVGLQGPAAGGAGLFMLDPKTLDTLAEYNLPADAKIVVSVDRLDYTKGMEERLLSIERTLEQWPDRKGPLAFVQVGAPSRTRIATYRDFGDRVRTPIAAPDRR